MNLFRLLNNDDAFTLVCLIFILYIVGSNMAQGSVRRWGRRASALAYVVFGIYAFNRLKPTDAGECLHIAFRGLFASGLAVGLAWIVFSIMEFVFGELKSMCRRIPPPQVTRPEPIRIPDTTAADARRREEERQLDERRIAQRQEEQLTERRRRENVRFTCQTLYDRNRQVLLQSFPPDQLHAYFGEYLSDKHTVEDVEQRAVQLKQLLQELIEGDNTGKPRFKDLAELHAFFQQEQGYVAGRDYPKDIKESLLAELAVEEHREMREMRQR